MQALKNKFISVIIPFYFREHLGLERLNATLLGFNEQVLDFKNFEVIVIDDGGYLDKNSFSISDKYLFNLVYASKSHSGMASSLEYGISLAKGEYIFLGIDDNIPHPLLLVEHLNSLAENEGSIVIGREYHIRDYKNDKNPLNKILSKADSSLTKFTHTDFESLLHRGTIIDKYLEIENILSKHNWISITNAWLTMRIGNHSLSKKTLKKIGGIDANFDPSGWYMDLELGYRLWKHKIKALFNFNAITYHISHDHSEQTIASEEVNHRYFYNKHRELSVKLVPFYFKMNISIAEYSNYLQRIEGF